MAFRSSFRVNIFLRVAGIAALLLLLLWSLLRTGWDAVPVACAALVALLVIELVRYVETGTRDLATLLRSVAAGDFTSALPQRSRRPPFADYEQASRSLIQTYQRLDLQRAASDELLRAVIEHVGIAVLCFTANGRMAFANPEARRLLWLPDDVAGTSVTNLSSTDPRLPERLLSLQDDERAQFELGLRGDTATLLLHARRFTLLGESFTVVVCHDIRQELESRDVQAWQALTRVLTHEMMNSLTPIVTLSGHLRDRFGSAEADATESIEVIHERSSGLARFIEAYRQFSHPPVPAPSPTSAASVVERVARLKKPELAGLALRLEVVNEAVAMFHADARQVEQVLINLVRNAQQALAGQGDGCIELRSAVDPQGRVLIHVTDNGPGIGSAMAGKVFMPFFTTRTGGTGIGLALSRQLMQLNRGSITMTSVPGRCRFTLRLPAAEQPAGS